MKSCHRDFSSGSEIMLDCGFSEVLYSYEIWNMFLGEINIHSRHIRVHDGGILVFDQEASEWLTSSEKSCPLFVWANCGYVLFFMTF
jgi:hypothetical protein